MVALYIGSRGTGEAEVGGGELVRELIYFRSESCFSISELCLRIG